MSVNLKRKLISVPKFWAGGVALAAIALIAFGGLRVAQPQNPLPATVHYASVSIQSSKALTKLSVEQPRALSDAEAPPDVRSPDSRPGTGNATPIVAHGAEAPRPLALDRPAASAAGFVRPGIQQPGTEAEPQGLTEAVWAPRLSNFRDPRPADSQRRNGPDPASLRADSTYIGGWAEDIGECRTGGKAPIVINSHAAKTASVECNFGGVARAAENRWRVAAICAAGGQVWHANIVLKLAGQNLTWSSERGTATYVRCKR